MMNLPFNAYTIRKVILEQSKRANVGHIGSALSIADMLVALYSGVLHIPGLRHTERDRFVLSKGHAALALYAALHLKGWLSTGQLNTYCTDNSLIATHPERVLEGIDFSSGSLGQGLSMGAGAALAARLQHSSRRVFVVVSDAECNEGSIWETIMFAAHHRLANLTCLVDVNGQQALGYTRNVLDTAPLAQRWQSFGWDVHEVDGHDIDQMILTMQSLDYQTGAPHVLLCRTTFGKGVSYMENQIRWHYMPMSDAEFAQAMGEIQTLA